jgi:hypothetical protein
MIEVTIFIKEGFSEANDADVCSLVMEAKHAAPTKEELRTMDLLHAHMVKFAEGILAAHSDGQMAEGYGLHAVRDYMDKVRKGENPECPKIGGLPKKPRGNT